MTLAVVLALVLVGVVMLGILMIWTTTLAPHCPTCTCSAAPRPLPSEQETK